MKLKHKLAYMECAHAFAKCSVGVRLKVGSVIVKDNKIISAGYNALPEALNGLLEDENGKTKAEVRHAEKNALMGLIRSTNSSVGSSLFVTHSPCYLCAVDIVDAGIVEVYFDEKYRDLKGVKHLIDSGIKVYKKHEEGFNEFFVIEMDRGCDTGIDMHLSPDEIKHCHSCC